MSRRPFIAGNWKLHHGPADAHRVAAELRSLVAGHRGITLALFPTAISVTAVVDALHGSEIGVGVQEIEGQPNGALTGGNSALMAREAGCTYALVGHSERRLLWGETDAGCAKKTHAAFNAGLLPVLCVGETLQERKAGHADEVVARQLRTVLDTLAHDQIASLTVAYEPVWAIGTGETATPEQAQSLHMMIRSVVSSYVGKAATDVRILYGGSVKPSNAAELLACPDIDGALVGGASLDPRDLAAIIRAAAPLA